MEPHRPTGYLGATGVVSDIADAVDIRGPAGTNTSGGGGGTDTNSYFIDAWLRTPKGSTVSSNALTSPGTWNNDPDAPGFTTKPTDNVAAGTVYDISDLPASASTDDTFDYHRFRRDIYNRRE